MSYRTSVPATGQLSAAAVAPPVTSQDDSLPPNPTRKSAPAPERNASDAIGNVFMPLASAFVVWICIYVYNYTGSDRPRAPWLAPLDGYQSLQHTSKQHGACELGRSLSTYSVHFHPHMNTNENYTCTHNHTQIATRRWHNSHTHSNPIPAPAPDLSCGYH